MKSGTGWRVWVPWVAWLARLRKKVSAGWRGGGRGLLGGVGPMRSPSRYSGGGRAFQSMGLGGGGWVDQVEVVVGGGGWMEEADGWVVGFGVATWRGLKVGAWGVGKRGEKERDAIGSMGPATVVGSICGVVADRDSGGWLMVLAGRAGFRMVCRYPRWRTACSTLCSLWEA